MVHDQIPELDIKGLRRFGLTFGSIIGGLFGLAFPLMLDRDWPIWPWVLFTLFAGWALVAPVSLRPVYTSWMRVGLLVSRITTPIILGLVFMLVITPMGALKRLIGSDAMARERDQHADSYRIDSVKTSRRNLERPY